MLFNSNQDKVVVVVDAYSTGKYLPDEIIKRGFSWVHVVSRDNLPPFITAHINHVSCLTEIFYQNNFNKLVEQINQFNVIAVIAGTETSIELTEQLAAALHLPGNDPAKSHLRRNKFHMVEAIRSAGLHAAKQYRTNKIDELIQWYQLHFAAGETIVIKPLHSAGTDHVTFCSSVEQIKQAAGQILGKINKLGLLNQYVLAQSFLEGQEYVVNTVSVNGKHHLTDIWRCQKQRVDGAGFVPGCEILLPYEGDIQTQLRHYAFKALDVLGFVQGPAHFEIMFTPRGPAIIEVGARVQGGVNPHVHVACMGTSQLTKAIDSYLDPKRFLSYYQDGYKLDQYSRWADLIVPANGIVKSFTLLDEAQELESFYSANVHIKPGDYLLRTVDLYTSPGSIYLINKDPEKLEKDYIKLRELEKDTYEFIST